MGMENEEAFISLRKSLDSFRDVALAEYAWIKNDAEKEDYSYFVTETVKQFLKDNRAKREAAWRELIGSDGQFLEKESSLCPPGFIEIDGICVPI